MNQGVVKPETPRQRRAREELEEDVNESPLAGRRVEQRLRNFRPQADTYFLALGGPLPYMTRLRAIHTQIAEHERQLALARRELAEQTDGDDALFATRWRELAERWNFDEVNDLIDRHNRWYPAEAKLAMDPRTGDYVLVAGERYSHRALDADWVLARFPATLP